MSSETQGIRDLADTQTYIHDALTRAEAAVAALHVIDSLLDVGGFRTKDAVAVIVDCRFAAQYIEHAIASARYVPPEVAA